MHGGTAAAVSLYGSIFANWKETAPKISAFKQTQILQSESILWCMPDAEIDIVFGWIHVCHSRLLHYHLNSTSRLVCFVMDCCIQVLID